MAAKRVCLTYTLKLFEFSGKYLFCIANEGFLFSLIMHLLAPQFLSNFHFFGEDSSSDEARRAATLSFESLELHEARAEVVVT